MRLRTQERIPCRANLPSSGRRNMVKFKGQWYILQRNLLRHYHLLFQDAEEAFDIPTFEGVSGKSGVIYVETLRDLYKIVYQHDLFSEFKTLYGEKRLKNMMQKFMLREVKG